jgi:hypothetical protein
MPGLISGVDVSVGLAFSVGVADGGNQIMVGVAGGVSEARGISVGRTGVDRAQEAESRNPRKRIKMTKRFIE